MNLENCQTDDLLYRSKKLVKDYCEILCQIRDTSIKADNIRKELLLIREELIKRDIEIDGESTSNI